MSKKRIGTVYWIFMRNSPSPIPGFKTWAEAFVYDVKSVIDDYGVKPIFIL